MITLYTAATPNGRKISIALEVMGLEYELHTISLSNNEQKEPWYLAINPNGKIPAIVDHGDNDLTLFESGAILTYLAEKTGQLLPTDTKARYEVLQWLHFQMSGIGPMQGQANVFFRYWENRYPEVTERYQKETRRLYQVLDNQLVSKDFIADTLSIADIALYPWIKLSQWADIGLDDFSSLSSWLNRLDSIEAFQRGMEVPAELSDTELLNLGKAISR